MSEAVGSAAEEAARLLSAVEGWARTRLDSEHLATGGAECLACPVCQAISAARQVKPETVDHLLASGFDLDTDPQLSSLYHHIIDTVSLDELEAFRAGDG